MIYCIFVTGYTRDIAIIYSYVGPYNIRIIYFIIYQCYVYRTNIRHIPPEVAWECDTTSVIRRKHAPPLYEKKDEIIFFLHFFFLIFFLIIFFDYFF